MINELKSVIDIDSENVAHDTLSIFEVRESNVRSYSRSFPTTFATARGSHLVDIRGRRYLDFLSGAGALNYGHNHPTIKAAILEYLAADGITHALDLETVAKANFLSEFAERILEPRGLPYKIQFPDRQGRTRWRRRSRSPGGQRDGAASSRSWAVTTATPSAVLLRRLTASTAARREPRSTA